MPTLDRKRIEETFRDGTPEDRAAVVRAFPPHHFRAAAATLSQSDDVLHRVMAMGILTTAYCYGRACDLGAELALAGHALGAEVLRSGRRDLQPETLSLLATGAVHALRQLGRHDEALRVCDRLLRYHEQLDASDRNLRVLRLARAEILMELCGPHETQALLQALHEAGEVDGASPAPAIRGELGGAGTTRA